MARMSIAERAQAVGMIRAGTPIRQVSIAIMGKVDNFFVDIDNREGIYYPGQPVSGKVSLDVTEELKLTSISVRLHGYADVHWSESKGSGDNRRTVYYRSSEMYVNESVTLLKENSDITLQKGHYNYPFSFRLPPNAPSSYEATIGRVRWYVQSDIDIPWAIDKHTKRMITVVNLLDLNTLGPEMMGGGEKSNSKTMCCLCCESDPITATMKIDRLGFVPGEAITFNSEINNMSNRDMKCSKGQLIMQVTYITPRKSRTVNNVVYETKRDAEIPGGGTDVWTQEKLFIPPVPPSFLRGCNIIDIRYMATMNVVPCGIGMDLLVPVEVTVGSIPLASIAQQHGMTLPSAPPPPYPGPPPPGQAPPPAGAPQGLYNDNAMPTMLPKTQFASSAFGSVNAREEGDDENNTTGNEYAPQYAYYNWDRPTPAQTFDIVDKE